MPPKHNAPRPRQAAPAPLPATLPATLPFDVLRAATTAWLVSGAPFFWAPPLWVLALMTPRRSKDASRRGAGCDMA